MTEKLDERVGYMTISVLMSILTEHVKSKIVNGKYTGDLNYLIFYKSLILKYRKK